MPNFETAAYPVALARFWNHAAMNDDTQMMEWINEELADLIVDVTHLELCLDLPAYVK